MSGGGSTSSCCPAVSRRDPEPKRVVGRSTAALHLRRALGVCPPPPPPVSRNHLAQEPTPGSAVKFSHHFFYQGSGFFMFLVDVGQLFRCAGHHFMRVTTGPPIRGDPISHSQAHIPLKPLPPALDPFPEATSGTGFPTAVRKNQPLVPRSNIAGSWTRGGGGQRAPLGPDKAVCPFAVPHGPCGPRTPTRGPNGEKPGFTAGKLWSGHF